MIWKVEGHRITRGGREGIHQDDEVEESLEIRIHHTSPVHVIMKISGWAKKFIKIRYTVLDSYKEDEGRRKENRRGLCTPV